MYTMLNQILKTLNIRMQEFFNGTSQGPFYSGNQDTSKYGIWYYNVIARAIAKIGMRNLTYNIYRSTQLKLRFSWSRLCWDARGIFLYVSELQLNKKFMRNGGQKIGF